MSNATHSTTAVRLHLVIRVDGRVWSLLECRDGSWQSSTRYRPCDEPISTDQGPHTEASILDLFTPLGDGELEIINRREI